jgi:hypothetical protein
MGDEAPRPVDVGAGPLVKDRDCPYDLIHPVARRASGGNGLIEEVELV